MPGEEGVVLSIIAYGSILRLRKLQDNSSWSMDITLVNNLHTLPFWNANPVDLRLLLGFAPIFRISFTSLGYPKIDSSDILFRLDP